MSALDLAISSSMLMKFGGDDIAQTFTQVVKTIDFPYKEVDLTKNYDWDLMTWLAEQCCCFNEVSDPLTNASLSVIRCVACSRADLVRLPRRSSPLPLPLCVFRRIAQLWSQYIRVFGTQARRKDDEILHEAVRRSHPANRGTSPPFLTRTSFALDACVMD